MTPESAVGAGQVVGGWNFVIAAYAIAWTMLGGYFVSLVVRSKEISKP